MDEGREEIKALAMRGIYPPCDNCDVYTSTLSRAKETCTLIYGNASKGELAGFNEVNFGAFEGMTYEQIMADARYAHFFDNFTNETHFPGGGDSFADFSRRVCDAFTSLVSSAARDVIVVCHGGTIARIRESFFPVEGRNSFEHTPLPAHGITLELDGGKVIACSEF